MIKYSFDRKFDRKQIDKYVAFCYNVKENELKPQDDIDTKKPYYFIKYENKDEDDNTPKLHSELRVDRSMFRFIPMIRGYKENNKQRSVIYIQGASGSGKSVLTNTIATLFHNQYPNQKIYFVSNNNVFKDDSLTHSIYTFIKLDDLITKYSNPFEMKAFKTGSDFDNSLMIFDDVDLNDNIKHKKIFFAFLGILLKFKRKNLINIIYTAHDQTDYNYTRLLLVELNMIVIYNGSLMNRSNRILKHYLKLTTDEIKRITENKTSRWSCINCDLKTVITQNEIYGLK